MVSPLHNSNDSLPAAALFEHHRAHQLAFGRPVQPLAHADKKPPLPDCVPVCPLPASREMREKIFVKACHTGNEAEVQHLLSTAPSLTACQQYDKLVQGAVIQGNSGMVDVLLAFKKKQTDQYTFLLGASLRQAVHEGHVPIVQSLLEKGAHLPSYAAHGVVTVLHLAILAGHKEVVKQLVQAGADINASGSCNIGTPLTCAVECGDQQLVQWLLEQGADPNQRAGNTGMTPLAVACQNGELAKSKRLIEAGALIDRGEHEGPAPLALAVQKGHEELAHYLLRCGADVNGAGDPSQAPLCKAVANRQFELSKVLLQAGAVADLLCEQKRVETPLMFAVRQGDYWIAELLVNHGADLHKKGPEQLSALEISEYIGFDRMTAMLRAKATQQGAKAGALP